MDQVDGNYLTSLTNTTRKHLERGQKASVDINVQFERKFGFDWSVENGEQ